MSLICCRMNSWQTDTMERISTNLLIIQIKNRINKPEQKGTFVLSCVAAWGSDSLESLGTSECLFGTGKVLRSEVEGGGGVGLMLWHIWVLAWVKETSQPCAGSRRTGLLLISHAWSQSDKQFLWSPHRNIPGISRVFAGGCVFVYVQTCRVILCWLNWYLS